MDTQCELLSLEKGHTMWDAVGRFINTYDSFLITSHINPDGDAIGSEVALKLFLEDRDKTATIVNVSPTPVALHFLDPENEILVFPDTADAGVLDHVDAVFLLDFNTWEQLGNFARPMERSSLPRACIDHHVDPDGDFADVFVTDTSASATGVLVYEMIHALGGEVSRPAADALYTAIVTDTGSFRFTNTDERTFRAAAALCALGVDPSSIYKQALGSKSWGAGRLMGPVLSTIETAAGGRLAWIHATHDMMKTAGATYEDMDGFADLVRAVSGVELVLFFKETGDGHIKVSLRSNGNVDAYSIAKHFGGGGHRMASGMRVDGPLEVAVRRVVDVCLQMDGVRERP
jgi:phosphoesterase RecJ-like protein